MHGIKCRFCGKEYFYESKICRECEEYAIYSGLTKSKIFVEVSGDKFYKWNCKQIINKVTTPIIRPHSKKMNYCITKEPQNYKFDKSTQYFWNSETAMRLRKCLKETIEIVSTDLNPETVDDFMDFLKVRTSSLLSYE